MNTPWYINIDNLTGTPKVSDNVISDKIVSGMTNNTPINIGLGDQILAWGSSGKYSDQNFSKGMSDYVKQHIKANAGWSRDSIGNFSPQRSTEVFDRQQKLLESMGGTGGTKNNNPFQTTMRTAVTKGMTEGAEQMVKESPIKNMGWGLTKKMESWAPKAITDAMKNPYVFWGGIAAGTIGLVALVRSFLSSNKESSNTVQRPQQYSPSTSFWRT